MNRFFEKSDTGAKTGTGNVVAMDRFRSGKSLSPIRQAEAYWHALRDGALVPRRSQIDPRGLGNILEYTFIIERIAPGVARFRLAGQHLNELIGMEVRGMPLSAFFTPAARIQLGTVLEHMFDAPAVAELGLRGNAPKFATRFGVNFGATPIEARMILLPLKSDQGVINRALGVLIADGKTSGKSPRFDIATTRLHPVAGTAPRPAASAPSVVTVPGFGETADPFAAQASSPVSTPASVGASVGASVAATHLRLVK